MKYVVIGASGQIGQELAKRLPPDRTHLLTHERIEITDRASIERGLADIEYDAIVNLAAFHDVNGCEKDREKAFAVNALGVANVAEAARSRRAKLVHISSDYVFGLDETRRTPYLESDAVGPLNVYGASKAAGEHLVRALAPDHLIIRTSSVFGAVTSRKGWTFPEMILRRAQAGDPLRVVTDQSMSPTYAFDLASAIVALVEAGATGTVHVTNGGGCTWHAFAAATLRLAGIERAVEEVSSAAFPSPARRPAHSRLDSERLESWGIPPLRPWEDALRAYLVEKGVLAVTAGAPPGGA